VPAPTVSLHHPAEQLVHAAVPKVSLYAPAKHAVQATPSEAAVYPILHTHAVPSEETSVLGGHVTHPVPASFLYAPAGQSLHRLAPDVSVYVAGGHVEQVPVPVVALYVPAPHPVHATPFEAAVYPTLHVHTVLVEEDPVLVGHVEHEAVPTVFLYVPAKHALQLTPPVPAAQVQLVAEFRFTGHVMHDI
jgi:hypothetical protein